MHVDRLRRAVPARLPHLLEQPPAADRRARIARERGEQVELLRRQLELARRRDARGARAVDLERCRRAAGPRRAVRRATPARDGADARDQLAQAERLHDVVVGAELEPDDPVGLLAARGDDDDRHVRALAQPPADVEPVDVGQAQVQQHEVGPERSSSAAAPVAARSTSKPSRRSPSTSGSAIASSSSTTRMRMPRVSPARDAAGIGGLPNLCCALAEPWPRAAPAR